MYSNSVIVAFVVNARCVRVLVGKMTVNDDALLSCVLSFFLVMSLYTDRVRVNGEREREREREREAERKSRVANRRRQSEGQGSTQEGESKKDRTLQG